MALNELSGPIPSRLGGLSRLRVLDLAGNGGTTTGPTAPTITNITPGPRSLTITWERNAADTGRTITRWQIRLNRIRYLTNNLGVTVEVATPLPYRP